MRHDKLARLIDKLRLVGSHSPDWSVATEQAEVLFDQQFTAARRTGKAVADRYGLLLHYTTEDLFNDMLSSRDPHIGFAKCWLTPTAYAACVVPYNLGVDFPRNVCLLVDVSSLDELWGPGTCRKSRENPYLWKGGAIEFFSPRPISFRHVKERISISTCGDN